MLDALEKKPLIIAEMRLGEGTGALAAMPLLDMACAVCNESYTFSERVCAAVETQVERGFSENWLELVIVAHGGTQMAAMERFARPHRSCFDWPAACGSGFVLEGERILWRQTRTLRFVG